MLEILRDSIWQFIGAFFAFIAVILFWIQRRRKRLTWKLISCTPLLSVDDEIKNDIQVSYKDKLVQDVQLIILEIINEGNIPIKDKDYERPISINFDDSVQLLAADVTEINPDSLKVYSKIDGNKVLLPRILMNGGDWFRLKILVNYFNGKISVDGRIEDVKEIREYKEKNKNIAILFVFIIGLFIGMISEEFLLNLIERLDPQFLLVIILGLILIISYFIYKTGEHQS